MNKYPAGQTISSADPIHPALSGQICVSAAEKTADPKEKTAGCPSLVSSGRSARRYLSLRIIIYHRYFDVELRKREGMPGRISTDISKTRGRIPRAV